MSKATVWPEVVDALVTTLRADTDFRAPTTVGDQIPVFDGGEPGDWTAPEAVIIGAGYGEQEANSGNYAREWASIGTMAPVEESGTVNGYVVVSSGNETGLSAARTQGAAILSALATAIPSGQDLGIAEVLWLELRGGSVTQVASDAGVAVVFEFAVDYRARLAWEQGT